jgi:hypothetical protein
MPYSLINACLEVYLRLLFKMCFMPKYIKIIFFILKKLFLKSAHQNNLKHKKIKFLIKKNNFFQNTVHPRVQTLF